MENFKSLFLLTSRLPSFSRVEDNGKDRIFINLENDCFKPQKPSNIFHRTMHQSHMEVLQEAKIPITRV